MPTARIYQAPKSSMSSGRKGRAGRWVLEFEPAEAKRADPLTGWAGGGGDARADQVRLAFPTKEDAIAYCEREGLKYEVVPEPPRRLQLQSYADNFK